MTFIIIAGDAETLLNYLAMLSRINCWITRIWKRKSFVTAAPEMQIFINVNEISIYDLEFLSFIFSMSQLWYAGLYLVFPSVYEWNRMPGPEVINNYFIFHETYFIICWFPHGIIYSYSSFVFILNWVSHAHFLFEKRSIFNIFWRRFHVTESSPKEAIRELG